MFTQVIWELWGSRCSCSLSATRISKDKVACENSHLSLLLAARDISPGKMPVPQRRKFNTDHVKSVRNLVRSSDWQHSSYIVFATVYKWQTRDNRPQRSNIINMMILSQNSQYWWNIIFFRRSIWVLLELVHRKHKTLPKSFRRNIKPIWNPVTDVIGMECLSLRWRYPSWRKIPSSEEWEEHTVFELKDKYACFLFLSLNKE